MRPDSDVAGDIAAFSLPRMRPKNRRLVVALTLTAVVSVLASLAVIFAVSGPGVLSGGPLRAGPVDPPETVSMTAITRHGIEMPEGFAPAMAHLADERAFLLGESPAGVRRVFVFDARGAAIREVAVPLPPDWQVEAFAPIERAGLLLAGRQGDGAFLARIEGQGDLAWVRIETASRGAPGPIRLNVSEGLVHALWPGPGPHERSLAAYSLQGARLWRRPLSGHGVRGEAGLAVSQIGEAVTLAPTLAGQDLRRGVLTRLDLSGAVTAQTLGPADAGYGVLGLHMQAGGALVVIESFADTARLRIVNGSGSVRTQVDLSGAGLGARAKIVAAGRGQVVLARSEDAPRLTVLSWDSAGQVSSRDLALPGAIAAARLVGEPGAMRLRALRLGEPARPQLIELDLAESGAPVRLPATPRALPGSQAPRRGAPSPLPGARTPGPVETPHAAPAPGPAPQATDGRQDPADDEPKLARQAATREATPPEERPPEEIPGEALRQEPQAEALACSFVCAPAEVPAAKYPIEVRVPLALGDTPQAREALIAAAHRESCAKSDGVPAQGARPDCR